jgi:Ala-tRNA(Pro) deacylase
MNVVKYLKDQGCSYKITEHNPVFTAERLATVEHVPAHRVAKPVIIRAGDGHYYVCVLPADRKISLYALKQVLDVENVRLATEHEMKMLFPDVELGAEPPLGSLYGMPTLMDRSLSRDKEIVFQAGTHEQAVWMPMEEYKRLVEPRILKFSYPAALDDIEPMPLDPFFYDPFLL